MALRPVASRLVALAEAEPGREVCGVVVSSPSGDPEVWWLANRAADPGRAFLLDSGELLRVLQQLDAEGRVLLAVYHSHPFGGAELSAADLHGALLDGAPLLGGVAQVVVALERGRAVRVRAHWWDGERYRGADLWTPVR